MASNSASSRRLSVLKNRSDFQRILKQGRRFSPAPWLLVGYIENDFGQLRCGWTLPRKVGTAVTRNKLKRWSREILRNFQDKEKLPVDINLVFRPSFDKSGNNLLKKLSFIDFEKAICKGLKVVSERTSKIS